MRTLIPLLLLSLACAQEPRVEIELNDGTVLRGTLPDFGTRTYRIELDSGGFALIGEDTIRRLRVLPGVDALATLTATASPEPGGYRLAFSSTGVDSLRVSRSLAGSPSEVPLATLPAAATGLFDREVLPGVEYRYVVRSGPRLVELLPEPLAPGTTVFSRAALEALLPPELDNEGCLRQLWNLKRTLLEAPDACLVDLGPGVERRAGLHPWLDEQLRHTLSNAWKRTATGAILEAWDPKQGLDGLRPLWLLDPCEVTLLELLEALPDAEHPGLLARGVELRPSRIPNGRWFEALLRAGRNREAAHVLASGGAGLGAARRVESALEAGPGDLTRWGGWAFRVDDEGWLHCHDDISHALLWSVRPARRDLDAPALAPEPLRMFVHPRPDASPLVVWAAWGRIHACDAETGALLASADVSALPGVETVAVLPGLALPEQAVLAVHDGGLEILTLPDLERVTLPIVFERGPFPLTPTLQGTRLVLRRADGPELVRRLTWEEVDGRPRYVLEPPRTCIVEAGDSLRSLAREHLGVGTRWKEIERLNPELEAGLRPGMQLLLPLE